MKPTSLTPSPGWEWSLPRSPPPPCAIHTSEWTLLSSHPVSRGLHACGDDSNAYFRGQIREQALFPNQLVQQQQKIKR